MRIDDAEHEHEFEREDPVLWELLGADEPGVEPSPDFVARTTAAAEQAAPVSSPTGWRPFAWAGGLVAAGLLAAWATGWFAGETASTPATPEGPSQVAKESPVKEEVVDQLVARLRALSAASEYSSDLESAEQVSDEFFGS